MPEESPPINPITMLELDALRERSADLQQKYQVQFRRFLGSQRLPDDNHRKARLRWRLAQQEAEAGVLRWIAQGCAGWGDGRTPRYATLPDLDGGPEGPE